MEMIQSRTRTTENNILKSNDNSNNTKYIDKSKKMPEKPAFICHFPSLYAERAEGKIEHGVTLHNVMFNVCYMHISPFDA